MNIKLVISYDGTNYFGWQKTPFGKSIEETLEKAIGIVLQEKVSLEAASRTDRGVHAEGQVVRFSTSQTILDLRKLKKRINSLLPKDISILSIEEKSEEFHPTLSTTGKEYHYYICKGLFQLPHNRYFSWHFASDLCLEAMREEAKILIGTHDFSAFCNEQKQNPENKVRTLFSIEIIPLEENRIKISMKGNHFLYKMVRNIVGSLVYIGCGKLKPNSLLEILKSQDRKKAGLTAPAKGLRLHKVFYDLKK